MRRFKRFAPADLVTAKLYQFMPVSQLAKVLTNTAATVFNQPDSSTALLIPAPPSTERLRLVQWLALTPDWGDPFDVSNSQLSKPFGCREARKLCAKFAPQDSAW